MPHTVRVYIKDIMSAYCSPDSFHRLEGAEITSRTFTFRIKIPQSCGLNRQTGSSVNVNTGVLSDNLELFTVKGNSMLSGVTLYYSGNNPYPGSIGNGWKHSFEYRLLSNVDGYMVLAEPSGATRFYQPNGSTYITKDGDSSVLVRNADNTFTITELDKSSMTFSSDGKLTVMVDRYNKSLTFNNPNGDLTSVTDGIRSIAFGYDTTVTPHRLTTILDPKQDSQNPYRLEYDGNDRLYRVVYPVTDTGVAAAFWEYGYDNSNLLASKRDPGGNPPTIYHYQNGRSTGSDDPEGQPRTVGSPTGTGNVRTNTFTEKDGGIWTYNYDITTGRLLEKIAPDDGVTPLLQRTTSYTYYSSTTDLSRHFTLTRSKAEPGTDGVRYTTFYTYDANSNLKTTSIPVTGVDPATVTDPATDSRTPVAFRYSYEMGEKNRILTSSDERDPAHILTTGYYYDNDDGYLRTTVTDPSGAETVTRQYTDGRTKDVTDANGKVTGYTYRSSDLQLETVTGPDGVVTYYSGYDANGNNTELQVKDADGIPRKTICSEYDARNRLRSSTTIAAGQPDIVTTYSYDANNNMTSVIDPEQHETKYEYNYNRQVTKTTDDKRNDTVYTYGATGCPSCGGGVDKLTAVYDAKFAKNTPLSSQPHTAYQYNQLGLLTDETDPLNKKIHYTYHENGKVKEKYDATASTPGTLLVTYSYNSDGQLTNKHYTDGSPDEGFTYDANGRIQTAYNGNISYTYAYHTSGPYKGRLQSITDNSGRQVYYDEYDNLGQRQKVTVLKGAGADERVTRYEYDKNRPWKITSNYGTANARTYEYQYDKLSRRHTLSYPHGVIATHSYDNLDRLTSIRHASTTATISFANYSGFDKTGNRKNRITNSGTQSYTYDEIYRLQQAITPQGTENYTYDAVGNRLTGPGAKDTASQQAGAYDAANRQLVGRKLTYDYNNAGNQSTRTIPNSPDKSWTITWDLENRLKRMYKEKKKDGVVIESSTFEFKYDPFGRRIEKKLTPVVNYITRSSTTWNYIYDDDNIAVEIYTPPTGPQEKTFYTHGAGTDGHLAMERNNGTSSSFYYFHADGLGSILAITDQSSKLKMRYDYDSFGMVKPSEFDDNGVAKQLVTFRNSYTYTGREWDKETGLYYYRARYYDPMEGRFLSKDPIGFKGGDVNLYGYTKNNPIRYKDPSGNSPTIIGAIVEGAWGTLCMKAATQEAESLYKSSEDKKKHCYASCYFNRCMLLVQPMITMLGGLSWELSSWTSDSINDLKADLFGIIKSYNFKSCKENCDSCLKFNN